MIRTYNELKMIPNYLDRFRYLKLDGKVADETFGMWRWLNQNFYNTYEWKHCRLEVIARDKGCDLGVEGYEIQDKRIIRIHHLIEITKNDILTRSPKLFDLNNLITTTETTHRAIHYGDESMLMTDPIIRLPNDTCPWKL